MTFPVLLPHVTAVVLPYDPTGLALTNLIISEVHPINEYTLLNLNLIIPNAGPIFLIGLMVTHTDTLGVTTVMTEGNDYTMSMLYDAATMTMASPIYGGLFILNSTLTGTITISYQSLGGPWVMSRSDIVNSLLNNNFDPRVIFFDSVAVTAPTFPALVEGFSVSNNVSQKNLLTEFSSMVSSILNRPTTPITISTNVLNASATPPPVVTAPNIACFYGGENYNGVLETNVIIYNFSNGTSILGCLLLAQVDYITGAGNGTNAIFGTGDTGSSGGVGIVVSTTANYSYASNLVIASGVLAPVSFAAATGNNSTALFTGGGTIFNTLVSGGQFIAAYTVSNADALFKYANNTFTASTNLLYPVYGHVMMGNATEAILAGGISLYNSLEVASAYGSPPPTSVFTACVYSYANNTWVTGSNATLSCNLGAAASNTTTAIKVGFGAANELYTYASGLFTTGSTQVGNQSTLCAISGASNGVTAIFAGDEYSGTTQEYIYTFASNTMVTGGLLIRGNGTAAATAPCYGVNY